jgi:hypothetical protein
MDSLAGLRTAAYARFSSSNQKDTSLGSPTSWRRVATSGGGGTWWRSRGTARSVRARTARATPG